jgi:hypothetical protein
MSRTAIESLRRLVPVRDRLARLLHSAASKALLGAHVIVALIILARSYGWLQPLELNFTIRTVIL